jgi:hypothetical protein
MGKVEDYTIVWLSPTTKYGVGENPCIALSNDNKFFEVHQAGGWQESHYLHYHTGEIQNGQLNVSPSSGRYDDGADPAIAVMTLASGKNILVEVHCSQGTSNRLWSRIGVVNGTEIQWGTSFGQDAEGIEDAGASPSVAITKDGNVVEVHKSDKHGQLWYKVGEFSEQEGKINWKNKAFHYDNGDYPTIALARTKDSYILVETHAGDSDNRVYSKATIPITHRLIGELSFLESVGIDLESHGIGLDEKTKEWERLERQVPPSQGKQAWEKFKLIIMFVPFVPDIISITENSLEYDRGDTSVAPEIVLDAALLGIDIFPVGKLAKGTAKSVVAVFKSIAEVSKKFPLDEVVRFFGKRNLGPLADWFNRHPNRFYEIVHNVEICKTSSKSLNISVISTSVEAPRVLALSGCIPRSIVDSANRFGVSLSQAFKKYGKEPFLTFLNAAEKLGIKSKAKFEMMVGKLRNRFGQEALEKSIALRYPSGKQADAITIADDSKQCIYTLESKSGSRENQLKFVYEDGEPKLSPDGKNFVQEYKFYKDPIASKKNVGRALPWVPNRFASADLSALSRSGANSMATGEVTECAVGLSKDGGGKVWMHHFNAQDADVREAAIGQMEDQMRSLNHAEASVFKAEDFAADRGKEKYYFRAEENQNIWKLYVEYQNNQGAIIERELASYSNP